MSVREVSTRDGTLGRALACAEAVRRSSVPDLSKLSIGGSGSNAANLSHTSRMLSMPNILDSSSMNTSTRTPGRSRAAGGGGLTPRSKSASKKTPGSAGGDRYMANRSAMDISVTSMLLSRAMQNREGKENESCNGVASAAGATASQSPSKAVAAPTVAAEEQECTYRAQVAAALLTEQPVAAAQVASGRILHYHQRPHIGDHLLATVRPYARPQTAAARNRRVPDQPDKVMDAPDLQNDFYLQPLSWSANNVLAVALGPAVYLWDAASGGINELMQLPPSAGQYVASVRWAASGDVLAVGSSHGAALLYDIRRGALIRTMRSNGEGRLAALDWNSFVLSTGSRDGWLRHHDVRQAQHFIHEARHHEQEICGLVWSPDCRHLATGSNDNSAAVWSNQLSASAPLHTLTEHQAAVKGLAWCPWKPTQLATGAGLNDRCLRIWDVTSGQRIKAVDTSAQISGIVWNSEHRELATSHGLSHAPEIGGLAGGGGASENCVALWRAKDLAKVAELRGHTERVLALVASPDGQCVASAAADETLRVWRCFESDPNAVGATGKKKSGTACSSSIKKLGAAGAAGDDKLSGNGGRLDTWKLGLR